MKRSVKTLLVIGSVLLLLMAGVHGSGTVFVTEIMEKSNAEGFLKEIFPVLFVHPSLHLFVVSLCGFFTLTLGKAAGKVSFMISALVFIDVILAFYLAALVPGLLLLTAMGMFVAAGIVAGRSDD